MKLTMKSILFSRTNKPNLMMLLFFSSLLFYTGCKKNNSSRGTDPCSSSFSKAVKIYETSEIDYGNIVFTDTKQLQFAQQFTISKGEGCYLIQISNERPVLLIPEQAAEQGSVPSAAGPTAPRNIINVPKNVIVLRQPLDKTYLVSSSVMDFIARLDAVDMIKFSGTKKQDWFIEQAVDAMEQKKMFYAGKYSVPDYELLAAEGCNFAIENTMINHVPEVREKLEQLGIPVIVERSTYESTPLGRLEWIKLYGLLFGKVEQAESYFNSQINRIVSGRPQKTENNKIAFFFVTSSGNINIQKPNGYVANLIGFAGGEYVCNDFPLEGESAVSTVNMQFEDFYAKAVNADIIIYSSTIGRELKDINSLLEKSRLFADFKAVKNGRVYCTQKSFFQEVSGMADFVNDVSKIMNDDNNDLVYVYRVE